MAIVQELSARQMMEAFNDAAAKAVPLTFTCRIGESPLNLHSRLLACQGGRMLIESPVGPDGQAPAIEPGLSAGVTFKLGHHKYIFTSRVQSVTAAGAANQVILYLPLPQRMQRVQRRAFNRVDVPPNRAMLAVFWEGGSTGEAAGESRVTWEGWVSNLSAGGFQVRMTAQAAPDLDVGETVGVRMDLGTASPVVAEAQFRHIERDERGVVLMGFQFVGLNDTSRGREILGQVGRVVCDLQDLAERRERRNDPRPERRQFNTPGNDQYPTPNTQHPTPKSETLE